MAKIVTKFRYYKPGSGKKMGGYAKYIATREHAEKFDESKQAEIHSRSQDELIKKLLVDFPDSKDMLEYEDYLSNPTVKNASEFISRCIEDNAMQILKEKTYADYIATRPRAEKLGSHGLFTDDNTEIILSKVADELNRFQGNVYTMIVSLRREDATRLGFDNAEQWRNMLRGHTQEFAESLRIPYDHLKWYAAFHNEGHHPHVHVMMWSDVPSEGYLHKKGIMSLRSSLANDIFRDELHQEYEAQTMIRNTLKKEWHDMVEALIAAVNSDTSTHPEIEEQLILLAERLRNTKGKKIYGYLKKDVKDIIDSIVGKIADDENISKLYDAWWEKKCEILKTYYQNPPHTKPPLTENKEFKSLKNDIIREALKIGGYLPRGDEGSKSKTGTYKTSTSTGKQYSPTVRHVSATAVTGLFRSLAATFRDKIRLDDGKKIYVDKRQKREEEEKRNAEFGQSY